MVDANDDTVAGVTDMGEGSMTLCNKHSYKINRTNPGGICAFCLQEKLGKLVSSSLPIAVFPSSSTTSASHSFRSESSYGCGNSVADVSTRSVGMSSSSSLSSQKKHRIIPFLSYRRRKQEETHTSATGKSNGSVIFKRSKSTTTPSRKLLDRCENRGDNIHIRKKWLWSSFWYHPKRGSDTRTATNGSTKTTPSASFSQSRGNNGVVSSLGRGIEVDIPEEDNEEDDYTSTSPGSHVTTSTTTSFGRKVSRSRSVGCGNRSFSGDFFERISTGLTDCTLRRVESQREGHNNKSKVADSCMKEQVKCSGIFSKFTVTSSSSQLLTPSAVTTHQIVHEKIRSWNWAFASPIRAFSKQSASSGKSEKSSSTNTTTPNLSAMPSLLSNVNK